MNKRAEHGSFKAKHFFAGGLHHRGSQLAAAGAVLLLLVPGAAQAGGVVTNCTEAALRAAMARGGTVTFACDGTITLASTITNAVDTVLDATGHQVTISGDGTVRVFWILTNVTFTAANLTIANGRSDSGAGIYNAGGQVLLQNCTLANNSAVGPDASYWSGNPGTNGYGGAVCNLGLLEAGTCTFVSNSVVGGVGGDSSTAGGIGGQGGDANGGALANFGMLNLSRCLLESNSGAAGRGGAGGGSGGGPGAPGGNGNGGAIANFGILSLSGCLLVNNSDAGGVGGAGGATSYESVGQPGGMGGPGGGGNGGAIYNSGTATLLNCTFTSNSGAGGHGGPGGAGSPPLFEGQRTGDGGPGGSGGSGCGAVYDASGQCYLTNCTLALNEAASGLGGEGGPPGDSPYPGPPNPGSPGPDGADGPPGSGLNTTGAILLNTLLASNTPTNGIGIIADAGHNLSSDASLPLTGPASQVNADAMLGTLANNGGPTYTMALLPGSPAIDAGNTALAPATDQRGFPRPAGLAADMGAFEYDSVMPTLAISPSGATGLNILGRGNANQPCRLLSSTDLLTWVPIASTQTGSDGTVQFIVSRSPGNACRYYRLVMP